MKRKTILFSCIATMLLISGCGSTNDLPTEEPTSEAVVSDSNTDTTEAVTEETETKDETAEEVAPETSADAPVTVYGNTYTLPEGFEEVVEEDDGYERNAAGGYTYTYRNENLDMTISISEFNWSSAVPMEMSKEDFLQDNFDYYTAYPNEESQINNDYFYIITKDDKGNNDYFKEIVGDVFCTDIHVIYPADNSECESIKDDFLKSYVKNK